MASKVFQSLSKFEYVKFCTISCGAHKIWKGVKFGLVAIVEVGVEGFAGGLHRSDCSLHGIS